LHIFDPENGKKDELFKFCAEKDPSMKKKKALLFKTLLIREEEEVKKTYKWIVKKEHDLAIRYVFYAFIGLNNRHNEFNRKYIMNNFLDDIIGVYEFGQFYFKYFCFYLTPKAVTLEEVIEIEGKVKELLPKIDPQKK